MRDLRIIEFVTCPTCGGKGYLKRKLNFFQKIFMKEMLICPNNCCFDSLTCQYVIKKYIHYEK